MALTFSNMPLEAMQVRSLLGGCYGYASSWVSSSFLVTKEFVKREFSGIKDRLADFAEFILKTNKKIDRLETTLASCQDAQNHANKTFKMITHNHMFNLDTSKKKFEVLETHQEQLAKHLIEKKSEAEAQENKMLVTHTTVLKVAKEVADQRTELAKKDTALDEEHQRNLATVRAHYTAQNSRINSVMALLEVNRKNMIAFDIDLGKAIEESKKDCKSTRTFLINLKNLKSLSKNDKKKKWHFVLLGLNLKQSNLECIVPQCLCRFPLFRLVEKKVLY